MSSPEVLEQAKKALRDDDTPALRRLFDGNPELKAAINEPLGDFDSPPILHVRSPAMLDAMLDAGADINARSRWWAGGFGLLDTANPDLAAYAIERGAVVTVHAAARLGMLGRLKELVEAEPQLVHARGGDGQTPLHFASTVEIAEYLLGQGAEIDARDVDHVSTAAQYMVKRRPEVARYLVSRGCNTDLLLAAGLGDMPLAKQQLQADPDCIRMRVSDEYFLMIGQGNGGTIYQWELGWYVSACQVAKSFGHSDLFALLMDQCPPDEKLLNACWLHDEPLVKSLLAMHPDLPAELTPAARRHVAHAARNNDTEAVRLMLTAGFPVNSYSQHRGSALHWAAFHGNAELARMLLGHHPALESTDNDYKSTPLNWAVYGSRNGWYRDKGDYAAVVEMLLAAGAVPPREVGGSDEVRAVLLRHSPGGITPRET